DNRWHREFAKFIREIFHLPEFLPVEDWPRFLRFMLESRQPDLVLISHSELGYQLLPFLRTCAPQCKFVDYVHIVEGKWRSGGFPRYSVIYRELLDRTFASSEALKSWMIREGGDS